MREIIFRGKRIDNVEWVYGFIFHCSESNKAKIAEEYTETNLCYLQEIIPETVGQFTGMTDKHGKKIFEHDVVQTAKYGKDNGNGCNFAGKDIFQIVFEDGGYCLRNEWRRFNLRPDTDYEVIGNIHDNPDLL